MKGRHPPGLPFAEDGPTDSCSPYALTKLHGEHWCRLYARQHGIQVRALRFFSFWGPEQRPTSRLSHFSEPSSKNTPSRVLEDGSHRGDLTHGSDVVQAIEFAIGHREEDLKPSTWEQARTIPLWT